MPTKRVVIAMSGGVDSSVAAALLKQQGYDVIGIMLRLWSEGGERANKCCAPDAAEDAASIADHLDIPFYMLDYQDIFKANVVDYFTAAYVRGITPNPCVICNKQVRFGYLLQEALRFDADYFATGHYAQIYRDSQGLYSLHKGKDPSKDQSYMLFRLSQRQLSRSLFPVGGYHKSEIRALAAQFGLPTASKSDSQDLCFLGDDGQKGFLQRHAPAAMQKGDITTRSGEVLGQHHGLAGYTVGQRKGLGIAWKEPLYVLELDIKNNRLVVGVREECLRDSLLASESSFIAGKPPSDGTLVQVQLRYRASERMARLYTQEKGEFELTFEPPDVSSSPLLPSPGQAVVLYQNDQVLGGGIISA